MDPLPQSGITRPKIGYSRLNCHLYGLGMTDTLHCLWCPTQLDTPKHLLLHCLRHHYYCVVFLQSMSLLYIHRKTLADLSRILAWLLVIKLAEIFLQTFNNPNEYNPNLHLLIAPQPARCIISQEKKRGIEKTVIPSSYCPNQQNTTNQNI